MKVLFLSEYGSAISIAYRLQEDGEEVSVFIKNKYQANIGQGILTIVPSWREALSDIDLVICDGSCWGSKYKTLRGAGRPVFGVSPEADQINGSSAIQIGLLENCGFEVKLPTKDSINLRVEGWWNGRTWLHPFFYVFPHQYLMTGDIGPRVDDQGSVVIPSKGLHSQLLEETLDKFTIVSDLGSYRGPISLNVSVTESGLFAHGIQFGFISDGLEAILEGLQEPLIDILFETAHGIKKKIAIGTDYLASVRISVPPWPHTVGNSQFRSVIGVLHPEAMKHLHFNDVSVEPLGLFTGTHTGVALRATASGKSFREMLKRVYRTVNALEIQNAQYRTDIGADTQRAWEQLKQWNWV